MLKPLPPKPPALDTAAVEKLIREELERNNKYFEFAQNQIEKDRKFYSHLYKWTGSLLTILTIVAAAYFFRSVQDIRSEMENSVNAELARNKATVTEATNDAKTNVARELENVRTEVQKRIDSEFHSDRINDLIATAAKEFTTQEITRIIGAEVSTQVTKTIQEQRPIIQKAAEAQAKEAVGALEPTIKTSVDKATRDQIEASVTPIQSQMEAYGNSIRIVNRVALARNDDRYAFDYLVEVADNAKPESKDPDLRNLADSTVLAIVTEKKSGLHLRQNFIEKQTPEAIKNFLTSPVAGNREAALNTYSKDDKSLLPVLVEMIRSDNSISVLYEAVERFNHLTKQSFNFWDENDILDWWEKNKNPYIGPPSPSTPSNK